MEPLLRVRALVTLLGPPGRRVRAVDGVSFDVAHGEVFGLVGESGCGKSAACRSIIRLFAGSSPCIPNGRSSSKAGTFCGLTRALAAEPEIIVADEPVSALDVSIQAQNLNLFEGLKRRLGLAYLFIAHDLTVVHHISDRIAVMYLGEIVECASGHTIFDAPQHPYTQALLSAIPEPDPSRRTDAVSLSGELPDPASPPPGCGFSTRCPIAVDDCRLVHPDLRNVRGTDVRCIRAG